MSDDALTPLETLALTLYDIGAVQFGKYKLSTGKKTSVMLDLRLLVSYPGALHQVAMTYSDCLDRLGLKFDLLTAPPMAGLPIGTALCLQTGRPLIYPRKTAKSYGSGKGIEGTWSIGQKVVVVDDVITSGNSIIQTIAVLKASGLRIKHAVVLIDREQGGAKMLDAEGYQLHSVMSLNYLLSTLRDQGRISQKQYKRATRR
ncbi:MAG: orotate phosphoribosyltransferase [Anaerolineaceae bacterium]|nr:MAG: orotate phosphoribosyltransferase [Anaerolineaceae bacterium]